MTNTKPIPMVILALYQNDVQFGDTRIPFQIVKCITIKLNFKGMSYHLFCLVQNYCEAFKQNICSDGSF